MNGIDGCFNLNCMVWDIKYEGVLLIATILKSIKAVNEADLHIV